MCLQVLQVRNLKEIAGGEAFAGGLCRAVDTARDGRSGVSARCQARNSGDGSGQSGGPGDQDSAKQTGQQHSGTGKIRTNGMAHETHAKTLPAELGAPAFVDGWQNARSGRRGGLLGDCRRIGLCRRIHGSCAARLAAGLDADLRFRGGRAGVADGAVRTGGKWGLLLRRPLEAMSRTLPLVFVYWLVIAFSLKKLYLWAAVNGCMRPR